MEHKDTNNKSGKSLGQQAAPARGMATAKIFLTEKQRTNLQTTVKKSQIAKKK